MAKPYRKHNQRQAAPRYKYRAGDTVYFHAQPHKNKDQKDFLCKGVILRQPGRDSRVYKVAIVAVNPHSVLHGHHPELATLLLGKRFPRGDSQLMATPSTGILSKSYDKHTWLEVSEQEQLDITRRIGK